MFTINRFDNKRYASLSTKYVSCMVFSCTDQSNSHDTLLEILDFVLCKCLSYSARWSSCRCGWLWNVHYVFLLEKYQELCILYQSATCFFDVLWKEWDDFHLEIFTDSLLSSYSNWEDCRIDEFLLSWNIPTSALSRSWQETTVKWYCGCYVSFYFLLSL